MPVEMFEEVKELVERSMSPYPPYDCKCCLEVHERLIVTGKEECWCCGEKYSCCIVDHMLEKHPSLHAFTVESIQQTSKKQKRKKVPDPATPEKDHG